METKRVLVATDTANLYAQARENGGRVNYQALLNYANELGTVVKSCAYVPQDNGNGNIRGFLVALKSIGYSNVVVRPLRHRPSGRHKSDLDTVIAMDVWEAALLGEIDVVVLASGDSDFCPLVERLVERGIAVHVIGPDRGTAWEMIVAANQFLHTSQVEGLLQCAAA